MSSSLVTLSSNFVPYALFWKAFDGFEEPRWLVIGFEDLLALVNRVYSWTSHLYKGRKVGMQAATTPNKTSHVRQYQFGMLSPCSIVSTVASSASASGGSYKWDHLLHSGS